jgi:hypothetical protein
MIRPVLYVDLPRVVYAIDCWARERNTEYARFIIAPDFEESRSRISAVMSALWPVPGAMTLICEDRWRPLGVAQTRARPGAQAWDMIYLAAMTGMDAQPSPISQDEVYLELVQRAVNDAITRGVHRFFARMDDDLPEVEVFGKLGFQRYARELTYVLPRITSDAMESTYAPARLLQGLEDARTLNRFTSGDTAYADGVRPEVSLRKWQREDAWGLLQLYDACTPRRVQVAEGLTSDELLYTRAGGRMFSLPLLERQSMVFVQDHGARLGGWLKLRFGRGTQPHQMFLMAHPDDPETPLALVRFGLRILAEEGERPVVCLVREYEGHIADALRACGFEHQATRALLVRHLAMRALRNREVPALESRVVYGVRGFGTTQARLSKGEHAQYATRDH